MTLFQGIMLECGIYKVGSSHFLFTDSLFASRVAFFLRERCFARKIADSECVAWGVSSCVKTILTVATP
jgi:hypothetical protein